MAAGHRLMDSREASKVRTLSQGLLQYRAMLFGFIYSLVRDVAVAEEIFQEVAVVALEKERQGGEPIREPAQWLKEVVRRLVLAGYRTRKGQFVTVDRAYLEQVTESHETESVGDLRQDRLDALEVCLGKMSESNRDLLRRRYVSGASYDEIGGEVQRTPGSLRVLIHRLQQQLADCINRRLTEAE